MTSNSGLSITGSGSGSGDPQIINYLRQEIRGVMVLDGAVVPVSSSSITTTTNTSSSVTKKDSTNFVATTFTAITTTSTNTQPQTTTIASTTPIVVNAAQQLVNNRLSRMPSQLQQAHFKNLWKHYRKCSLSFGFLIIHFANSLRTSTKSANTKKSHMSI